ncbi:MAG: hypothetical protein ACM3SY_15130 [Candidatus Omnitrophota bacterium]
MNPITNNDLAFLNDQLPSKDGIMNYQSSRRVQLEAQRKETQDITLTTKEGDVVTISALSQTKSSYMAFDYAAMLKGKASSAHEEKMTSSSQNEFAMTVNGELNDEELADIRKVIGDMDGIMKELIDGDMKAVMDDALKIIDDTDTISGIDAVLEFHQSVSMKQQYNAQVTGSLNGDGKEWKGNDAFSKMVANITKQLKEVIAQSSVDPEKLKQPVDALFKEMMAKLPLETPQDKMKSALLDQVNANLQKMMTPQEKQDILQPASPSQMTENI